MSLRARLLLGLAVIALVYLGVAAAVTTTIHRHLVEQVDQRLTQLTAGGGGNGGRRGGGPDDRDRGGVLPPPVAGFADLYTACYTADGQSLYSYDGTLEAVGRPEVSPAAVAEVAASGRDATLTSRSESGQGEYRVRLHRLPDNVGCGPFGAQVTGARVSLLAVSLGDVNATVDNLLLLEGLGFLAALVVLGAVGWWVVRLGIRPIKQMTATAGAIAEAGGDDLTTRVPEAAPHTEAGQLARALNRMLGRIERAVDERTRSEERLRQFVADASHELRTPLTTIRGYAELYRMGGLPSTDSLDDAMHRTEQEAQRMGRLVEDMLTLAKFDQHRPLETHPVDLARLVADAARDAAVVAPERRITTAIVPGQDLTVAGDADRLRQVLANIVGNALVHTPPTSGITLRVARADANANADAGPGAAGGAAGGRVVVEVADEGPGMPPEVAGRITERFYRADPARARNRGGSGLGMSIVDAIVTAHGGGVELDTGPDRGTTVRITLPVEAPPAPAEPADGTAAARNGEAAASGMGGPAIIVGGSQQAPS